MTACIVDMHGITPCMSKSSQLRIPVHVCDLAGIACRGQPGMQGRRRREPRAAAVPQRDLGPRKAIQEPSTERSDTSDPYLPIKALGGPRSLGSFSRPREAIQLAVVGVPLLPHTSLQLPLKDFVVHSWLFYRLALDGTGKARGLMRNS